MKFTLNNSAPEKLRTGVLVLGILADGPLPPPAAAVNQAAEGRLAAVLQRGDLEAKAGATLPLHDLPGMAAPRVLLVSLGRRDEFGEKPFRDALGGAARALAGGAATDAAVTLADVELPGRSLAWRLQQTARLLADGAYRFNAPRAVKVAKRGAHTITLLIPEKITAELERAVRRGAAVAEGMALARDLGNLPGNVCHPPYLAATARALGRQFKFKVDVLESAGLEKLGMGSLLSVGRGSDQPSKLIVLRYPGAGTKASPVVLVGKGITFDTGGVSLKPGAEMDEMKFDMSGAGSVLGALKAVALLGLPLNVIGLIPAAENMVNGSATRPGDVVTSMSGQTIEILNTDAEGRLVLCDALTYAERFQPACVIDVATLTGACITALGSQASGLFANDDGLAAELLRSGVDAGDRAWQLPLWDEYQEQLKSNFADMANVGGRPAGAVTAACFLARFTKAYKWAHLDIAGTASVSGEAKGSTGRPVPLLAEFLFRRADEAGAGIR